MQKLTIKSSINDYNVLISNKISDVLSNQFTSDSKYIVFADSKIPSKELESILNNIPNSQVFKLIGGEEAKSLKTYELVIKYLLENNVSKNDVLVAVGGGTILDLIGYVAMTYKRGISYISIPSTTLSVFDACIGGKVALNVGEIKNAIGGFYPPGKVLIGLDILKTLDERNFCNGLFEAIKMGIIKDSKILEYFDKKTYKSNLEELTLKCLKAKQFFIEQDEFDVSIRNILNYGHTIGHAIEINSCLLHGEAVANGMLVISKNSKFNNQLIHYLDILKCPKADLSPSSIMKLVANDKKVINNQIKLVLCDELNKPYIKTITLEQFKEMI